MNVLYRTCKSEGAFKTMETSLSPRPFPRRTAKAAHLWLGLWLPLAMLPGVAVAADPPVVVAELVAPRLTSVVSIRTVVTSSTGQTSLAGAGFIITPDGLIATNRHVIAGASRITVEVPNLGPLQARPVYVAEYIDFALLKIDVQAPLQAATLGDSDTVRVGDTAIVLGNPLGIGESLSVGVVSALNRDIGEGRFDHFFQTDAAINHGNSGGAVFNIKGEVIGIATGLYSSPDNTGSIGIGFAMPINDAKIIIDQYLRAGKVVIGSVGVRAQHMTQDLADAFGLSKSQGSIITDVLPGSTAVGKLQAGDIVLDVDGQDATDTNALARMVAQSTPGKTYPVTFLRAGVQQHVDLTIGSEEIDPVKSMTKTGPEPAEATRLMKPSDPGFKVSPVSAAVHDSMKLRADQIGVVVTSVDPHGAAFKTIDVGDVILKVDNTPVTGPSDIPAKLTAMTNGHRDYVALLVTGQRGTRWVTLALQNMEP